MKIEIERGRRQAGGESEGWLEREGRRREKQTELIAPFELLDSVMPEVIISWASQLHRLYLFLRV